MHPVRVTDRLATLRKQWSAVSPMDHKACQDLARQIGSTNPAWERIGATLDVCEHLWLSWQQDMRRAHHDAGLIVALRREAQAPIPVTHGAVLVELMRTAVRDWGTRRLEDLKEHRAAPQDAAPAPSGPGSH